jgi:recombinational DNA repair protein (RecF pathway)
MGRVIRCDRCGRRVEERHETSLPSGRYCQFCYDWHLNILVDACSTPAEKARMRAEPRTILAEMAERRRERLKLPEPKLTRP